MTAAWRGEPVRRVPLPAWGKRNDAANGHGRVSCRRRTAPPWRAPGAIRRPRNDFTTAAYYQKIGQVLEEGKFQLAFFDDRLAMPDIYGGNPAEVVANGVRVVKIDPVATLMAMGFGTRYLGIGSTASTTYYEPFDVARRFQTVDHMIGGRAAWNVVTSVNDGEAHNMGREVHHGARPAL